MFEKDQQWQGTELVKKVEEGFQEMTTELRVE